MENRKGSGIFLGVVSVATLVVAIIGATFAYFSASVNSADDAVNVEAYNFAVGMTVKSELTKRGNLIPLNPSTIVDEENDIDNIIKALPVDQQVIVLKKLAVVLCHQMKGKETTKGEKTNRIDPSDIFARRRY